MPSDLIRGSGDENNKVVVPAPTLASDAIITQPTLLFAVMPALVAGIPLRKAVRP